jgi:elongation factor 1 alpha-like protein
MSRHRAIKYELSHDCYDDYDDDYYDDEDDEYRPAPPRRTAQKAKAQAPPAGKAGKGGVASASDAATQKLKGAAPATAHAAASKPPKKAAAAASAAASAAKTSSTSAAAQTTAEPQSAPKMAPAPKMATADLAPPPGLLAVARPSGAGDDATASSPAGTGPPQPSSLRRAVRPSSQLNMVVIGHVDAGKSTLMGRLLLHAGEVDERTMRRYEKESHQAGKASFRFAWVLDQSEEERQRGVTVDVGTAFFGTTRREVNVLDAPGHRDFVPSMISGASQADLALLVLNAAPGEFESGLSGQTREHVIVARSLGVNQLIVAVNQMDSAGWAQARYDQLVRELSPLLQQVGYRSPPPVFVPLSALAGENIAPSTRPASGLEWYSGRSLLEEIDAAEGTSQSPSAVGTRLIVADAFRSPLTGGITIAGTLQAGTLRASDRLLLLPARELVQVKALQSRQQRAEDATAGDHVEATVSASSSLDLGSITTGSVLCDPDSPVPMVRRIEVKLRSLSGILTKGQPVELYVHTASCAATLRKFVAAVDKRSGERLPDAKAPRSLPPASTAIVQLKLEARLPIELHSDCRRLGRVVLRDGGRTVAAGVVVGLL